MANGEHGGYRKPANPAPVSGPGRLSRRTDGKPAIPPGGNYGDRKAIEAVQSAAAPAANQQAAAQGQQQPPAHPPMRRPEIFAPTSNPNEPITSGVNAGPGQNDLPDDQLDLLFAIREKFPHRDLDRILDQR